MNRGWALALLLWCACSSNPPMMNDGGGGGSQPACDAGRDPLNCGTCGNRCEPDQACANGTCLASDCTAVPCLDWQVCANGSCADRDCVGAICPQGEVCARGQCLPPACGTMTCGVGLVCLNGACTEAACVGVLCSATERCVNGACVGSGCSDGVKGGTETATDCGGPSCPACRTGEPCAVPSDCLSGVCSAGVCGAAGTCANALRDGTEVDIDCGGGACPPCANNRCGCVHDTDCLSLHCAGSCCVVASCTDGLRDGKESDVDCGGDGGCMGCADGKRCGAAVDCVSSFCSAAGTCSAASCADATKNGRETDVDCGGDGGCPTCADGLRCGGGADCSSTYCTAASLCAAPTCVDSVRNGRESDVDCGGDAGCTACADGKRCGVGGDCVSTVCSDAGTCLGASCADGLRNGRESDVDCGGDGGCPQCGQGRACTVALDCLSRSCTALRCDGLTCGDNVKNGSETDIDCGGACPSCAAGLVCLVPEDCASRVCTGGVCQSPACNDGVRNGSELGVDCGGSCYPCGFSPPIAYPIGGSGSRGIVAADFNNDGKLDLATANYNSHDVSVLLGAGNGTFGNAFQYDTVRGGYQLTAAEVSGDANLDLLVHTDPDALGNTIEILLGNGDGTFGLPIGLNAGAFFDRSVAFGDLDGDGELDIAMGENSRIDLRWGNGDTTFRSGSIFFCPGYVNSLALGDFTGDGRPDLTAQVATSSASPLVITIVQQPDGGFPPVDCVLDGGATVLPHTLAGTPNMASMKAADVNSDGKPDLLGETSGFLALAFGRGDGGFVNGPNLGGACVPVGVTTADVNKDSGTDIVGACAGFTRAALSVSLGQGSAFAQTVAYTADGGASLSVAVGDFDRDGRVDAALSDLSVSRVLVYLNRF